MKNILKILFRQYETKTAKLVFGICIIIFSIHLSIVDASEENSSPSVLCDIPYRTEVEPGELISRNCDEGNGGVWKYCFYIDPPAPPGASCLCSDECDDCDDGTYRPPCNPPE